MQIEWVSAQAFGALRAQTLELAPGLNVVVGPNESGKSTWQSALYAALCGRRRGPGVTDDERSFDRQYRPWHGDRWAVGVRLVLDSSQRIEIQRDLAANVSSIKDVELGTDLATDLIFEGSPDGSRLLGLNRQLFRATASVRQADLNRVRTEGATDAMQHELQRVADTAGSSDASAANALALIERFRQERVGTTRINAVKPLRKAMDALDAADERLASARSAHEQYVELAAQVEAADVAAERARATAAEAGAALSALGDVAGQIKMTVNARLRHAAAANELDQAGERIAWLRERIDRVADLGAELAKPVDTAVPGELADLAAQLTDVRSRLAGVGNARPSTPPDPGVEAAAHVGLSQLRTMVERAAQLREPAPPDDSALKAAQAALDEIDNSVGERPRRPVTAPMILGGALGVVGLVLIAARQVLPGAAAAAIGAAIVAISLLRRQSLLAGTDPRALAKRSARQGDLADAAARFQVAREHYEACVRQRDELNEWFRVRGLPIASHDLRELIAAVELREQRIPMQQQWDALVSRQEGVLDQLRRGLSARGCQVGDDVRVAYESYASACAANRTRRITVEAQMDQLLAGASESDWIAELGTWASGLPQIESTQKDAAAALASALAAFDQAAAAAGFNGSVDELERRIAVARQVNADLMRTCAELVATANLLAGQLAERTRSLPSVALAEETAAAANSELSRIRLLEGILDRTKIFLESAQQHHYRDVAPVLVQSVEPRLPLITAGRYTRAIVIPSDLRIEVAEQFGELRPVENLSVGTREQIYLLLRLGLVEVLTKGVETCPLILDDVTVHADEVRKQALLELVRGISTERQVILFSQERLVRDWAVVALDPTRDRLIHLPTPASA